jgi:hypothetical protein
MRDQREILKKLEGLDEEIYRTTDWEAQPAGEIQRRLERDTPHRLPVLQVLARLEDLVERGFLERQGEKFKRPF